ncbi:MAG TPA: hypothetical protein VF519_17710 [Mycobacteriales bacterium]|jgi:hypothetical protein
MRRLPALAAAAALAFAPHPAHAAGAAPVTGYGEFSPGLTALPLTHYIKMTVQGVLAGVPAGPFTCVYDVESVGNYGGGAGTRGTVACTGAFSASSTTCASQRSGMTVAIHCPTATGAVDGSFQLQPTSAGPVIEYFTAVGTVTVV